jgi:hypothetical protein
VSKANGSKQTVTPVATEATLAARGIAATALLNVRFTPESGHWNSVARCPLCAKSGHEEGDFLNLGVTRRNGRGVVMKTQVIGVV